MNVIAMSKCYKVRPSEIMDIEDSYTRYCFDEAVAYIISKIQDGDKPSFKVIGSDGAIERPHYSSMADMYSSMGFSQNSYKRYKS